MSEPITLRPARASECAALTELCLRSKAHHGYDAAFMEACREELAVTPDRLKRGGHCVADLNGVAAGFVQILSDPEETWLEGLFVDPIHIGRGIGSQLMRAARQIAIERGARQLEIHADPHAEAFYLSQGAMRVGQVPSESIPGRYLPQLMLPLYP
ncbi:MAG: GNAT family N-acetyltransferase [Hyphomonadaceae bacterium]|nr:GNAT family N-acetyltransferase [Hyphomonadaceae bacterium]